MKQFFVVLISAAFSVNICSAACTDTDKIKKVEMYPTSAELPANLLRFYLYFPYKVAARNVLNHITLQDSTGRKVDGAFLENRYDLWSPDRRRLTLLLNPGRVKTGLGAHDTLGRALIPGQDYSLSVNETALRGEHCKGRAKSVFRFSVTAADIDPPKPDSWLMVTPAAGTLGPLVVDLGSPHDHLSLAFRLRVTDPEGVGVPGRIHLGPDETVWRFTPSEPWSRSLHRLLIDETFEDLAGNRPSGVFDRPAGDRELSWTNELEWRPR
ncbi:MAG: hypothetical protein AAGJ87_00290 [Pseudomonadota bacterium]